MTTTRKMTTQTFVDAGFWPPRRTGWTQRGFFQALSGSSLADDHGEALHGA